MLLQSSLLLWVVTQVLLLGSQTNAQTQCPNEDGDFCQFIEAEQCSNEVVKKECPFKCNRIDCSPPWQWVGNQCFLVVDDPPQRSWCSALVYCIVTGGGTGNAGLAVPSNVQTLYDHMQALAIPQGPYWIGGSDLYTEGQWFWNNGTELMDHMPNSNRADECLHINNEPDLPPQKLLGNEGCGATLPFVCEKFKTSDSLSQVPDKSGNADPLPGSGENAESPATPKQKGPGSN